MYVQNLGCGHRLFVSTSFKVLNHVQWNPSNADTNGTHSAVRNIKASVFRRLPVIFPVGVAVSIHHAMAALATRWFVFVALAYCEGYVGTKFSSM